MGSVDVVGFDGIEGFRFYPTDQELILFLEEKRLDPCFSWPTILEANLYEYEPPQLFGLPGVRQGEKWCNLYCAPEYVKDSSERLNQLIETGYCKDSVKRATKMGYWKVTGQPRFIKAKRNKKEIGFKRNLVFYKRSRGSKGIRTNWVMHEFVIRFDPSFKADFVLCRVKWKKDKKPRILTKNENERAKKSRTSTKNGGGRAKKARVSFDDEVQPSHSVIFNDGIRNRDVENTYPESQCDSISSRNHVAENSSPESLSLPTCDSTSNSGHQAPEATEITSLVDPVPLAAPSALSVPDQSSSLARQLLISPESLPLPNGNLTTNSGQHAAGAPEYSSQVDPQLVSHIHDVLKYPLGLEWEWYFNSDATWDVPVSCPSEETAQATPLDVNSSESMRGFCGGYISNLISSRNDVAENISPESLPLTTCDSTSNSGHVVADASEYTSQVDPISPATSSSVLTVLDQTSSLAKRSLISPESQSDSISNGSHAGENVSPESLPQPSWNSTSNSGHQFAEAPEVTSRVDPVPPAAPSALSVPDKASSLLLQSLISAESRPLPNGNSITNSGQHAAEAPEHSSRLDPQLLTKLSAFCGSVDQTPFSEHPEKEFCSVGTRSDYDVLKCPLGFEWEEYFNLDAPWAFPVSCPNEATAHTTPLGLNKSKAVGGSCGGDIYDSDTETFLSGVSNIFNINPSEACLNPI